MNSYFLNKLRYVTFFGSFLINLKNPAEVFLFSIHPQFSNISLLEHENILLASDFTYIDTVYALHIKSLFVENPYKSQLSNRQIKSNDEQITSLGLLCSLKMHSILATAHNET